MALTLMSPAVKVGRSRELRGERARESNERKTNTKALFAFIGLLYTTTATTTTAAATAVLSLMCCLYISAPFRRGGGGEGRCIMCRQKETTPTTQGERETYI